MLDFRRTAAFLVSVLLVLASATAEAVCRMGPNCGGHGSASAAAAESDAPAPDAAAGHACCGEKGPRPAPRAPDCPSAGDCCAVSSDLPEAPSAVGLSATPAREVGSPGSSGIHSLVQDPVPSADSALAGSSQRGSSGRGRPTPLPLYLLDLSLRN